MTTVYWNHANGQTNEDGFAIVNPGNPEGTHALASGGFIGPRLTSADESNTATLAGNHCHGMHAIVGTYMDEQMTGSRFCFPVVAGPPGTPFRAHIWTIVEE